MIENKIANSGLISLDLGDFIIEGEDKVRTVYGVESSKVNIVFDPPWTREMMSEEALLELGMM